MTEKTALTFEERIKAAYLHYVRGVMMQDIAVAYEVNLGRVSEACYAVRLAAEHPKDVRKAFESVGLAMPLGDDEAGHV